MSNCKLELNSQGVIRVRQETVRLTQGKQPYRILFISDLHLGWRRSAKIVRDLIAIAPTQQPDLILLGGDLVDRRAGLPLLQQLIQQLLPTAPLGAIAGNHDHWVGVQSVKQTVENAGGQWLDGQSIALPCGQLDGGSPNRYPLRYPNEHTARILCAHNPIAVEQAQAYSLVFAGHLHGCQWVFWEQGDRLYPGAWFYRWNGRRMRSGDTTLLVSCGVGDTLPIRWNCPREVILCQIF
jgi:uncharacterized protein